MWLGVYVSICILLIRLVWGSLQCVDTSWRPPPYVGQPQMTQMMLTLAVSSPSLSEQRSWDRRVMQLKATFNLDVESPWRWPINKHKRFSIWLLFPPIIYYVFLFYFLSPHNALPFWQVMFWSSGSAIFIWWIAVLVWWLVYLARQQPFCRTLFSFFFFFLPSPPLLSSPSLGRYGGRVTGELCCPLLVANPMCWLVEVAAVTSVKPFKKARSVSARWIQSFSCPQSFDWTLWALHLARWLYCL